MLNTVKALTAFKHSCDALIDNGDRASEVKFLTTSNNNVIAYTRHHNNQTALMVLNLGTSSVNASVYGLEAGEWKLAIDVDNITAGMTAIPVTLNTTQSFTVPAGGYKVYYKGEPVAPVVIGDINGDGEVNIADVNAIIDIILNGNASENMLADVNSDGEVNIADVNAVINIILS